MANTKSAVIGKDVIESLTIGMYEDSRFIFREYIQNAADQIDKAERDNLLSAGEGEIYISIDPETRTIVVEDNATGIAESEVLPILMNIAQSTKTRGVDKGFRGIGRLGGLAYCNQLVFETSYQGEATKSIMTWDAQQLKHIINDRKNKEEAAAVIDEVTAIAIEPEDKDAHYFKVSLIEVTNNQLLDVREVRKYLSMVAPVPFNTQFLYARKIYDDLKTNQVKLDEYKIYINTEKLYKGYSSYIYEGDAENRKKIGEIIDVLFFKENDDAGNILFWGWYGITEKNQSLNQINLARGFRLRKANIQVGDEFTLIKLHRDRRFQFYFVGEVYALHPELIPNARRDYFSENRTYQEFENKLKLFFHTTIHKLCYAASEINSSIKRIEEYNVLKKEIEDKTKHGFTDRKEHEEYHERLEKKKDEALKAESRLQKLTSTAQNGTVSPISKILDRVQLREEAKFDHGNVPQQNAKPKYRTDNLTRLTKEQRKFLGDIFRIIKNVLPNEIAENLITKIEENMQ